MKNLIKIAVVSITLTATTSSLAGVCTNLFLNYLSTVNITKPTNNEYASSVALNSYTPVSITCSSGKNAAATQQIPSEDKLSITPTCKDAYNKLAALAGSLYKKAKEDPSLQAAKSIQAENDIIFGNRNSYGYLLTPLQANVKKYCAKPTPAAPTIPIPDTK